MGGLTWAGNQTVSDGAVVYLLGTTNAFPASGGFQPAIDGFDIRGGDQQGFPGNINDLTGQPTGLPPNIVTQGGAVFANAYVRQLQITNNVVENNGGGYGTIRIGTPDLTGADENQHNEKVRIAGNRIIQNAGTNLAGAIGLFAGSDGYEVSGNDICGNFSLEYGAGVSVYGHSPGGKIHDNRITLNNSNDEGAGVMIAGALPANPDDLSTGTGAVDIYANEIKGNLANDDGGGIRFLMAGNFPMNVYNNVIASNVSTHEGGGIGINDAPNVRIYNNTIMDNITTATAVTSNGMPAPAGVSTSENSQQLQDSLPANAPTFSTPLLFNNVMWSNRAGTRGGTTVSGIGLAGATDTDFWDVGVADGTGSLAPVNSVIQQDTGEHDYTTDVSNSAADPQVVEPWTVSVSFATWRQNPAFVDANVVAVEAPADLMGNYHLSTCGATGSSACDIGAPSRGGVSAPSRDIDGDVRPNNGAWDAGADEALIVAPPPPVDFLFSTAGNGRPPGVTGARGQLGHLPVRTVRRKLLAGGRCQRQPGDPPRRQRGRLRPGGRHPLVHVLRGRHDAPGRRSGPGRGRRLLERQRVVGVLRRHGARADHRHARHQRHRRPERDAVLLDRGRGEPARCHRAGRQLGRLQLERDHVRPGVGRHDARCPGRRSGRRRGATGRRPLPASRSAPTRRSRASVPSRTRTSSSTTRARGGSGSTAPRTG